VVSDETTPIRRIPTSRGATAPPQPTLPPTVRDSSDSQKTNTRRPEVQPGGVGAEEYRAVDKKAAPLDPPQALAAGNGEKKGGPEAGTKLRTAGRGPWEKGGKTSDPGEGQGGGKGAAYWTEAEGKQ